MNVVAPHLVHQIPFLLPLYEHGPYRPYVVQAGIAVYSTLARARLNGSSSPARARRMVPDLRLDGLRKCGLYVDCWTNDSRLTLANVRAAADAGATVVNYAEVVGAAARAGPGRGRRDSGRRRDDLGAGAAVVNASGPWLDSRAAARGPAGWRVDQAQQGGARARRAGPQLVGGADDPARQGACELRGSLAGDAPARHDGRALRGRPGRVAVEEADIEQVLAEAAVAVDPALIRRDRVRATYAGLRVLPGGERGTTSARRETVYLRGSGGMLSVAGGKLTTYRRIALDVLEELRSDLGLHRIDRRPWPLPGAPGLDRMRLPVEVPPALRSHLRQLYGSLSAEVLAPALDDPALLEPLSPDAPDIAAQAVYAAAQRVGADRRGRRPPPYDARPARLGPAE